MKPEAQIKRRIELRTSKVIDFLTEEVETKKAILRYEDDAIEVQKHILTTKVVNLMERAGIEIEWIPEIRYRGINQVNGMQVKVTPLNHRSYESGAVIQIFEDRATSWTNTNKIMDFLDLHGIDRGKECRIFEADVSCVIKR